MTGIQKVDTRILVVDYNKELADTVVDFLSKFGYRASVAYGGISNSRSSRYRFILYYI